MSQYAPKPSSRARDRGNSTETSAVESPLWVGSGHSACKACPSWRSRLARYISKAPPGEGRGFGTLCGPFVGQYASRRANGLLGEIPPADTSFQRVFVRERSQLSPFDRRAAPSLYTPWHHSHWGMHVEADAASGLAAFGSIFFIFGLLLAVLWILVPFAIFGIKGRLDRLISEQKRANDLMDLFLNDERRR